MKKCKLSGHYYYKEDGVSDSFGYIFIIGSIIDSEKHKLAYRCLYFDYFSSVDMIGLTEGYVSSEILSSTYKLVTKDNFLKTFRKYINHAALFGKAGMSSLDFLALIEKYEKMQRGR